MLVLELGRKERIDHLTFAPDGGALVASCNLGLYIWRDLADGRAAELLCELRWPGEPRFTADSRWLFVSRNDLFRIDPATGAQVEFLLWGGYGTRVDPAPVEPLILATQHLPAGGQARTRFGLWRADDLAPSGKLWERETGGYYYYRAHFLPGAERFVRIEGGWVPERFRHEYTLATYVTATGERIGKPTPLPRSAYDTLLAPDGRWLALRDTNRIDLWPLEPAGGSPISIRNDNRKHFTDFAFHPSGKYLAAPSNDRTVKLFDTGTWQEARTFTWELGRMRSIAFSPDGALAAAGTDKGQVVVWDVDL